MRWHYAASGKIGDEYPQVGAHPTALDVLLRVEHQLLLYLAGAGLLGGVATAV